MSVEIRSLLWGRSGHKAQKGQQQQQNNNNNIEIWDTILRSRSVKSQKG